MIQAYYIDSFSKCIVITSLKKIAALCSQQAMQSHKINIQTLSNELILT